MGHKSNWKLREDDRKGLHLLSDKMNCSRFNSLKSILLYCLYTSFLLFPLVSVLFLVICSFSCFCCALRPESLHRRVLVC